MTMTQKLGKLRDPAVRRWVRRTSVPRARAIVRGYPGAVVQPGVRFTGPGEVVLHKGAAVRRNARIFVGEGARLEVLPGGVIGTRAIINVETSLVIGAGSEMSWDCEVMDTDFHDLVGPRGPRVRSRPVVIGEHVLIGARALILKGVAVGDGAIVAAGAVVREDVKPGTIVAGNPAVVVGEATSWR